MRRRLVGCAVLAVWSLWESSAAAAESPRQYAKAGDAAAQPGLRGPIGGAMPHRIVVRPNTTQAAAQPAALAPGQGAQFEHHHHGNSNGWLMWAGGYPYGWIGSYTSPFPCYYSYSLPYSSNYGVASQPTTPARRALERMNDDADAEPPAKPKPRVTSPELKARAGKFIGFGDANFGKQKYLPAAERYKTAAQTAPDLAEPHFRQGYALVALGQFESATKAFRRGLKIRSDWSDSDFRLDQIYGADRVAKANHLENLAKAVEANPFDSDLLVALGMQLYFDGQRDRAGVFFIRAAQLGGNEDRLLNDFLPKPAPAGAAKAEAGAKIVF